MKGRTDGGGMCDGKDNQMNERICEWMDERVSGWIYELMDERMDAGMCG